MNVMAPQRPQILYTRVVLAYLSTLIKVFCVCEVTVDRTGYDDGVHSAQLKS